MHNSINYPKPMYNCVEYIIYLNKVGNSIVW